MSFQISPGVNVTEIDLTTVVPSVLTTAGAFAGTFQWGPANKVVLVDSEITLSKTFGTPDSNSAVSFFTAANFLAYGNNLSVIRAVGNDSTNAVGTGYVPTLIENPDVFEHTYLYANTTTRGPFTARYPGDLGNSITVSVIDSGPTWNDWDYKGYFSSAPGTSDYAAAAGTANDELHIVVVDKDGRFTGTKGMVLETFPFVSKASDAKYNGDTNYYKQVIFNKSKYIYSVSPPDFANTNASWGQTTSSAGAGGFVTLDSIIDIDFQGGVAGLPSTANTTSAFLTFANKESYDISLVLTGDASATVQKDIIDGVANSRKDCVAFISPPQSSVVENGGNESSAITSWLTTLDISSSYAVADSGWKYQFDVYNNVYRWIPLNGDIAGLCVNTDNVRDPWYSPAGYNRGQIKNAIKLAWNPSKTYRDTLYAAGVNPVVSFPGQGIILFGDKTLQSKPSAFDRINVRRLFIVLEKAIARAAQYSLFEFNDEYTRAQFVAMVNPFLRDIQGRRGITDFKVVCDTTNNTPQVIDSNQFVGDIYIKPARSINYIQLNFVAVGTGVDFNTIVGAA